jgi:uncharacterized RDD family membrane protein YckC
VSGGTSIFAEWHRRALAMLADLGLQLLSGVVTFVGQLMWRHDLVAGRTTTHDAFGQTITTNGDPSGLAVALSLLGLLPYLAFWIWNRWWRQGNIGRSLGKSIVGLQLLDAHTGRPPGSFRAFLRELAHYVDSLVLYLGWLWPLWDARRQTLADKLCSTIVVVDDRVRARSAQAGR